MGLLSSKSSSTGFDTGNRGTLSGNNNILPSIILSGSKNKTDVSLTMTDFGAVEQGIRLAETAVLESSNLFSIATDVVDSSINAVIDLFGISSVDNARISDSAMSMVSEANNNVTNVAADSLSNNAYITDSVIASTQALGGQFGSDLAYLTDSALTNNTMLVDKTINTVDILTTQHQESLDNYGAGLKSQAAQYSADVGFLSQQSIQGNNELTALFGGFLADNSGMLNTSMLEMASLQEQGLDSALEVAGNVALDDSVEGITEIMKYVSLAVGVVGVAFAVRKFG